MSCAWWILGGGYTGTALARMLTVRPDLAGEVTITRRDAAAARALGAELGVRGVRAELGDSGALDVPAGSIVVCLAPPGHDPAGEIAALVSAAHRAARLIYVSSTAVYGPGYGGWIDESWPVAPITASGRAHAVAEAALAVTRVPWVALRTAEIYGPGRSLVDRIRAGTYRIVGDEASHVARIHVVDLATTIVRAATTDITGPINVADDDPAQIGMVVDTVAMWLELPPPERVPVSVVSPEIADMLLANRRIANRRLCVELGVELRYPTWREGVRAEIAAGLDVGRLFMHAPVSERPEGQMPAITGVRSSATDVPADRPDRSRS